MNWRYQVGKYFNLACNSLLRSRLPIKHLVRKGFFYPVDILSHCRRLNLSVEIVFDAGANVGQTSLYLAPWFPKAKIFAFEPVFSTYKMLVNNTKHIPSIHCFQNALGDLEKTEEIFLKNDCQKNSLLKNVNSQNTNPSIPREKVIVRTLDNFCVENHLPRIDVLKMDVEGYELPVLKGAERLIADGKIHFVYAEVFFRPDQKEGTQFGDLQESLFQKGFQFCGLYEPCRYWDGNLLLYFSNALWVNMNFRDKHLIAKSPQERFPGP